MRLAHRGPGVNDGEADWGTWISLMFRAREVAGIKIR